MDNNQKNNDQFDQQEVEALSPMRMRLRGTILGMYLETNEKRYLLSFILYLMAILLFGLVVIYAVQTIANGSLMKEYNHEFYGKLFTLGCWISSFVTLALFFAKRYSIAFRAVLITAFIIFLTYIRP